MKSVVDLLVDNYVAINLHLILNGDFPVSNGVKDVQGHCKLSMFVPLVCLGVGGFAEMTLLPLLYTIWV